MLKLFPGSLIHCYIARDLVRTFFLCLVSLLTLVLISRGILFRDLFFGLDIRFGDMAYLFLCLIPAFLLVVLPLSCMLSVFLTFLRMSTDRELIALKAGGVSIYQLLKAPVIFSLFCVGLNVLVSLYGISWGMNQFRSSVLEIANERAQVVIQPGVFNQDIFGITLFARRVNATTGELRQIIFEDRTRDQKNRITVLAPRGSISTDRATGSLVFLLHDGQIYRADGTQFGILEFKEYTIRVDLAAIFKSIDLGELRPKDMSWKELRAIYETRDTNAELPRYYTRVSVELQKRWALPAACFVLCIFGLPLGCAFEGVRRQMGVILSLVMFLLYYSIFSFGISVGESGKVPAVIALWAPNLFFLILGALGLYLVGREKSPTIRWLLQRLYRPNNDEEQDEAAP